MEFLILALLGLLFIGGYIYIRNDNSIHENPPAGGPPGGLLRELLPFGDRRSCEDLRSMNWAALSQEGRERGSIGGAWGALGGMIFHPIRVKLLAQPFNCTRDRILSGERRCNAWRRLWHARACRTVSGGAYA